MRKVFRFISGTYRYHVYYSKFKFLIRKNIRRQFEFRVGVMNPRCYKEGSCVACGCTTTALQFSSSSCDNACYPPFMSKTEWKRFKLEKPVFLRGDTWLASLSIFNATGVYIISRNGRVEYKRVVSPDIIKNM